MYYFYLGLIKDTSQVCTLVKYIITRLLITCKVFYKKNFFSSLSCLFIKK
uniref:Uncharacterized protein n=1 Tax=Polysiphonia sp. TaxID=1967842 RepID=A0A1Z1M3N3_9FLOR|nr:hypothetical protein [Polysiphonia sp.]